MSNFTRSVFLPLNAAELVVSSRNFGSTYEPIEKFYLLAISRTLFMFCELVFCAGKIFLNCSCAVEIGLNSIEIQPAVINRAHNSVFTFGAE
jgi:hypothetical protein